MRKLICWTARLYPQAWRDRYGSEFDSLLNDIAVSWKDVFDVAGRALIMRGRTLFDSRLLALHEVLPAGAFRLRSVVVLSLFTHAIILSFVFVASQTYVAPLSWDGPTAPSPPPPPAPPTEITDPRVFPDLPWAYSSLPLRLPGGDGALPTQVVEGVGIWFPPLPDIGRIDRRRNPIRRVWAGQALEASITWRVLPKYPAGIHSPEAVSVFLEYLIGTDGSVRVLRTSGPAIFANAARAALERWEYRPQRFENMFIEVISRVEVRFDGNLANAAQ